MEKITPEVRKEAKKLLKNGKIQEFFELFFVVDICHFSNGDGLEMETWTDGNVDMIISLQSVNNGLLEDFKDYVKCFDVEEEIEFHR